MYSFYDPYEYLLSFIYQPVPFEMLMALLWKQNCLIYSAYLEKLDVHETVARARLH